MYKSLLLFIFIYFFLILNKSQAQEQHVSGYFPVNNYTNDDFNSPVQIWSGTQTELGVFLFGNERKIIRFNGYDWSFIHKNPEDSIFTSDQIEDRTVRAFYVATDSTCYVARDHSLGIVHYNSQGEHVYTPFYYDESMIDVWSIYEDQHNTLYFISTSEILKYSPNTKKTEKIKLDTPIIQGKIQSSIRVNDGALLCMKYQEDSLIGTYGKKAIYKFDFQTQSFSKTTFTSKKTSFDFRNSYTIDGKYYLCDYYGQVFSYNKSSNKLTAEFTLENISEERLKVNYIKFKGGMLWAATENNGVGIFNLDGSIKRVFGDKEGLQDLNVFKLFFDKDQNLWLNLDNGISSIEFSSPTSYWNRMHELEGAVEAIDHIDDQLIIASRSGIFHSKMKDNRLMLPNTNAVNESTFDVKVFDTDYGRRTLVVGYSGIYEITKPNQQAELIANGVYGWELFQSPFDKNEILLGGEKFLGKLILSDNGWTYEEIQTFEGDIIKLEYADDQVYFGVKGVGIYAMNQSGVIKKLKLNENINIDQSHFYLSKLNNTIYVGYGKGLLKVKGDSVIIPFAENFDLRGRELNFHRLYSHPEKDILWAFIIDETSENSKKIIGYFESLPNDALKWTDVNSKSIERGVVHDIKFLNGLLYFGSTNGLIAFDESKLDNIQKKWNVYINKITVAGDKVLNTPAFSEEIKPIKHGEPIRFSLRSASYFNGGEVFYRSRLKGLSDEWSEYENTNFKVFDQLPHGTYTFEVQGKNFYDVESEVYQYTFTILPPWYFTWWAYVIYAIVFVIIIVVSTRVSIYRVKQKNKLLEETVKERTKEIAKQNTVLEKQKSEIIEINDDLLSSIKYAKRIQNTILPSPEILSTYFNDFFVYFLPKDIVSGDFYWARKFDNKIIWSAIDCTGHGVPGAFVSIVGNNALVRSTNEFGLTQPAKILNKLRELVIQAFKAQGKNDVKDGMDMALVSLDLDTLELNYAGANNPLVIVRDESIIEVKADKQPIGDFEKMDPFTNHTLQLQKGDCIYLYSDGFIDQFGGQDEIARKKGGKKFKSKPFKNLLIEISHLPMKEQKQILKDKFATWRGDLDQIDDVCVFGVRV